MLLACGSPSQRALVPADSLDRNVNQRSSFPQKDPRAPRANVKAMVSRGRCPFRAPGVSPAQAACLCRLYHSWWQTQVRPGFQTQTWRFQTSAPNCQTGFGVPHCHSARAVPSTNQPPKCPQSLLEKQQKTLPAGMEVAQTSQLAQCFWYTGDFQGYVLHFFLI